MAAFACAQALNCVASFCAAERYHLRRAGSSAPVALPRRIDAVVVGPWLHSHRLKPSGTFWGASKRCHASPGARAEVETDQPSMTNPREGLEESFAVIDTGKWECRSCGFVYDQAKGDPSYPIAPGIEFKKLPEDWRCPTCGAVQSFFASKSREVAGFAQNQSYGLGGNSLTSDQKGLLIWGSLLLFFALFLSGYFLN
eukprot:TRINITY_DN3609_c0_g1_i6.p1 TRINITY_DN3609_c0_g1~~TRINITY_DN3609_c0_g1_i6.p1  ORF type:complete len:225 (+),score=42.40 TRINITY_DN3609_c0_g1_i6:83-676(+)